MLQTSIAVAAMAIAACLAAAGTLAVPAKVPEAKAPSQFDYLVYASMADSSHPLSIAGYSAKR